MSPPISSRISSGVQSGLAAEPVRTSRTGSLPVRRAKAPRPSSSPSSSASDRPGRRGCVAGTATAREARASIVSSRKSQLLLGPLGRLVCRPGRRALRPIAGPAGSSRARSGGCTARAPCAIPSLRPTIERSHVGELAAGLRRQIRQQLRCGVEAGVLGRFFRGSFLGMIHDNQEFQDAAEVAGLPLDPRTPPQEVHEPVPRGSSGRDSRAVFHAGQTGCGTSRRRRGCCGPSSARPPSGPRTRPATAFARP